MNYKRSKRKKSKYWAFLWSIGIFVIAVFLANMVALTYFRTGHFFSFDFSKSAPLSEDELQQAYLRAVKDAEVAEPAEISHTLTPIVYHNPDLKWRGKKGESDISVVTWAVADEYDENLVRRKAESEIWVTVVPELQNFCRKLNLSSRNLTLRLKQLLGISPKEQMKNLLEIWVDPADLFRPSPDPEISDREAGLEFPQSGKFLTIHKHHIRWFKETKARPYSDKRNVWTRLGYTYDWGNPKSEIGLSEFVIRKGAPIKIHSIANVDAYCNYEAGT